MDRLDHLVADYLERRLLAPNRVQDTLAAACVERTADFGATICGRSRSGSRSPNTKSGSSARETSF